jgi:flagellar L-ring protein FlgH
MNNLSFRAISSVMAAGVLLVSAESRAQNLFDMPAPSPAAAQPAPAAPGQQAPAPAQAPAASPAQGVADPALAQVSPASQALSGYSMFVVTPPPPRKYAKHDLIEVIVNETSVQKIAQKYDNKKDYDFAAELKQFPSMQALFTQLALENGIGNPAPSVGVGNKNKFKGDGKMDRSDQVTARVSATVIDVKPNGTLVLEATESIQSGREISKMVLSGVCRGEDITRNNTIQSSQLANLDIRIEHEGDVKDTAEKGLIPRIFETLFNF